MIEARVTVYPRREILDPQGKAIGDALSRLGFQGVVSVRAGKSFEIELDTARAAFPYRYLVVEPPRVPERPVRPLEVPVTVAAVLYGLFLALFAATFSELRSGSVREAWQLERALGGGVPVIEVRL